MLTEEGGNGAETRAEMPHIGLDVFPAAIPESVEGGAVPIPAVGEPVRSWGFTASLNLPTMIQNVNANVRWRGQHQPRARPVDRQSPVLIQAIRGATDQTSVSPGGTRGARERGSS